MIRFVTTVGLVIVASCAVAVSFAGLFGLAVLCSFSPELAALVPVLVDAGAGVATVVWLAGDVPPAARRYARRLALGLLSVSVVGNAASHALVAYGARPHWLVVVAVGALAPAVLAAVIHLAALVKAGCGEVADVPVVGRTPVLVGMPGFRFTERVPVVDEAACESVADELADGLGVAPARLAVAGNEVLVADADGPDDEDEVLAKARELAAAGAGRPKLVKELGLKDHVARQIVRDHRPRQEGLA